MTAPGSAFHRAKTVVNSPDCRTPKQYGHIVNQALQVLDESRSAKSDARRRLDCEPMSASERATVERVHDTAARKITAATLDLGLALDAEREV